MDYSRLNVLLIEDDEDDYILVRSMLQGIPAAKFEVEWAASYDAALNAISVGRHDVYLLDYRLGNRNGLELLRAVHSRDFTSPVILLTGQGDYEIDVEAMKAGAADYLVKDQINPFLLERSIRYALERSRTERQLRFLSAQLLTVQEEERKRISRELHDSIGACLTAIKFTAENIMVQMEKEQAAPETLKGLVSLVQHTIDESRRIMTDLRPSILDDLGIITTINWFCRQYNAVYGSMEIEKNMDVEEAEIPELLKITIFRIMQEAFHNIAKYSKANRVKLSLIKHQKGIKLIVADNGIGFCLDSVMTRYDTNTGLGLISMRERAELSGGILNIESAEGKGTKIQVTWDH